MENPLVVERVEPLAELRCEIDRLVQAQAPGVAQALCQRAAGIEGQDQIRMAVGLTEVQDRDDVARLDPLGEPRLALEAGPRDRVVVDLGAQQLEHYVCAVRVAGAVDHAACAFAEPPFEPIVADLHRVIIPGKR